MTEKFRIEKDSMGELEVPADALWGAQTQRAVNNFPISGQKMPRRFIAALGLIKWAAAEVNQDLDLLEPAIATAIQDAALGVAAGKYDKHFPIDVYQTGSGTSSNMNANEVIARLAGQSLGEEVHPNDHVNYGQSSNDVIPTAIHVSAAMAVTEELLPSLDYLASVLEKKAKQVGKIVKTGRTHLMDAMPLRMDQELGAWATQIRNDIQRISGVLKNLGALAQGGTAVGTGINAHSEFGARVASRLADRTGIPFRSADSYFEAISCQDTAVELSGQIKTTAVSLMKISNDLRWMNSGPLSGLAEITLEPVQPGSSIMPGKVNPVIPEAVTMVAARVIGNDSMITIAGQSGNFQLNVMFPVVAYGLLESIELLARSGRILADGAIAGMTVNEQRLKEALEKNPILVTALNHVIGYEKGASVAKKAYEQGLSILEVASRETDLTQEELKSLLNPVELTKGGIRD
ncbi:MAG: class II fumarate hydratase [Pseudomonadota bacterium]|nr:class II fumarate hydratase [Pseudomonadota bacterium]